MPDKINRKRNFCHEYWLHLVFFLFVVMVVPAGALEVPPVEWQNHYNGGGDEGNTNWWYNSNDIILTSDGGYLVVTTSQTSSSGSHGARLPNLPTEDIWVVKLDSSGNTTWTKYLGGTSDEGGAGVAATNDGGFIITGSATSTNGDLQNIDTHEGRGDMWVVKLGPEGTILWQKSLGGSSSELGRSIRQTPDGGYIIAGETMSVDGDVTGLHGCYVVEPSTSVGSKGNIDFIADPTGNCKPNDWGPVAHFTDAWVVRLDPSGTLLWQKSLGGTYKERANSIRPTTDGGYILAGITGSHDGDVSGNAGVDNPKSGNYGTDDAWVVKLDSDGRIVWQKSPGGSVIDEAYDIIQTDDNGYIFVGEAASNDGDVSGNHGGHSDAWVVRLDASGTIVWQKTFGGSNDDQARSIALTDDGNYLIVGDTQSQDGDVSGTAGRTDIWVLKIDPAGTILWQKILSGPDGGTLNEYGSHGIQTPDRGFIITGITNSQNKPDSGWKYDVLVVKLSGDGSVPVLRTAPASGGTAAIVSGGGADVPVSPDASPTAKSPVQAETVAIGVFIAGLCAYLKKR